MSGYNMLYIIQHQNSIHRGGGQIGIQLDYGGVKYLATTKGHRFGPDMSDLHRNTTLCYF